MVPNTVDLKYLHENKVHKETTVCESYEKCRIVEIIFSQLKGSIYSEYFRTIDRLTKIKSSYSANFDILMIQFFILPDIKETYQRIRSLCQKSR